MSSSGAWSSVKGFVTKSYERQEDQGKIPLAAKICVFVAFAVSFLYVIIYFIKLGKATTSSTHKGRSHSQTKGVCANKCATPFIDILKSAFIAPVVICIVGISIAAIIIYAKMRSRGFEVAGGKLSNVVHSSSYRKTFLVFSLVAFIVWISVSIIFYIIMGYTNIKFLKVKEYKDNDMASCLKAGHHWCVHASPEVYWFFMFTIVTFFVLLVVGVSKYMKARAPVDEICAEASMMAKNQFNKIRNTRANAPGTLFSLISQSNERNDVKQQVMHALESDTNRCAKLRREYVLKLKDYNYRYRNPTHQRPANSKVPKPKPIPQGLRAMPPVYPLPGNTSHDSSPDRFSVTEDNTPVDSPPHVYDTSGTIRSSPSGESIHTTSQLASGMSMSHP